MTDSVTIDGVMAARRRMDKRICDAVRDFEEFSGLIVDAVSIEHIDARSASMVQPTELLVTVSADVRLPR